jgi:serine phosphatase RsbU (regulator of sigma subunit)
MSTGDVLVAFTDGVSEARNPEDEEFGEERLALVVSESLHLEADQIREAIVDQVHSWCRGKSLHDDLTLVVVKVKKK